MNWLAKYSWWGLRGLLWWICSRRRYCCRWYWDALISRKLSPSVGEVVNEVCDATTTLELWSVWAVFRSLSRRPSCSTAMQRSRSRRPSWSQVASDNARLTILGSGRGTSYNLCEFIQLPRSHTRGKHLRGWGAFGPSASSRNARRRVAATGGGARYLAFILTHEI